MAKKKNYWIRLQKDFFKRHDIVYIESLPGGEKIALFYLKLLLESIDHDGYLRFNELVPYDPEKLAIITRTDVNVVKMSLATLENLMMIEQLDDGTYYMTKLNSMLGIGNGDDANLRKKLSRDRKKTSEKPLLSQNVTPMSQNVTLEKEKDKEKELDKDKELETYIEVVSTSSSNLKESKKEIFDFLQSAFGRQITTLEIDAFIKLIDEYGVTEVEAATEISVLMSKFNIKYIEGVLKNRRDTKKEKQEDYVEVDLSNYSNWIE